MRKKIAIVLVICCFFVLCVESPVIYGKKMTKKVKISAPETDFAATAQTDAVRATRFLNMLNHNFSYNRDFESMDALINNATVALLAYESAEHPGYIPQEVVADYLQRMYGICDVDFSSVSSQDSFLENYVYIVPRGYTVYHHADASVTENEDGTYTVYTTVTVNQHDGEPVRYRAVSLFAENEKSEFGYQLVSSDILGNDSAT